MRLLEFLNTVNLFEAAKDRYAQMFDNLRDIFIDAGEGQTFQKEVNDNITWAMTHLKKQDKVIWYLRLVKISILARMAQTATEEEPKQLFTALAEKAANQLAKKMGTSPMQVISAAEDATSRRFIRQMEHFMSLGLPAIDAYVFNMQSPGEIIQDWTPIEDAWKEKASSLLDMDDEDSEVVIQYPDGSAWVNINRGYCSQEAEAMGHCGNAGARDSDTILSYRTPEKTEKGDMWKPHLTFILDTNTGLLGETKGRGNDKPSPKYHDKIVDLLKLPIIKGIRGGGYMPENNFMLSDLPQETQEELVEQKPGLASLDYDFQKRGMTQQLLTRMASMWEETETPFPEYKDDMFFYDTRNDLDGFVEDFGGDSAMWALKVLDGREHIWYDDIGSHYEDELYNGLPETEHHQIGEWLIENFGSEVEEWKEENDTDYDGTDKDDTWKIMKEYGIEEVTDALHRAEETGHQYGAEHEMYEALSDWLKDLPNERDWELSVHPSTTFEEEDAEYRKIAMPPEVFIDILDNHLDEIAEQSSIPEVAEIKELQQPYYGWQGFDESAAQERASEELHEAGIINL